MKYKANDPTFFPVLRGGVGEKNFGKQYRQGNRVYDAECIAMCIMASSMGCLGGHSYLYLVKQNDKNKKQQE